MKKLVSSCCFLIQKLAVLFCFFSWFLSLQAKKPKETDWCLVAILLGSSQQVSLYTCLVLWHQIEQFLDIQISGFWLSMPPKQKQTTVAAEVDSTPPITQQKNKRCWTSSTTEKSEKTSERAVWTSVEEAELVHYLLEVKRVGGTSNLGFKEKVWKGASDHILAQCNTIIKPMACKNKFNKVRKIFLNDIWLLTGSPASSSSSIGQSSDSLSSQASHGVMKVVLILGLKKNPYGLTLLLFISILVVLLLIQLIFVVSLGMASGWTISYKRMAIIWWDGWNSSKTG